MGKTEAVKVEMHPVSLQSVVLAVPKDEGEKLLLIEDLTWIRCEGLLAHLWSLRARRWQGSFQRRAPTSGRARSGEVDCGYVDRSLQLSEGGERLCVADRQVRCR